MLTLSDIIKLLPAHVDETTHNDVASDEETEVVDVEYSDIPVEHNDLLNPDDSECPYIRVGTDYYREVNRPQANGTTCKCLVYWRASTIKADFGKDYLNDVPKYDCFCTVPSHTDYRKIIGNAYNLYEPISHQPMTVDWSAIDGLLHHIFEEHYEYGLDYIQLLYQMPLQKLPILILVSEQRNTGKTTFLNLLKAIFQDNATFNTNEDFRSKFNSDWAGKLLIMVDEVLLSRREDSERLKNLSTATSYKMESKGKDRNEMVFFGKFVLCSN
ncbi:primase-helicase family protein, partial [uncultured Duncaniella sp.]